MTNLKKLTKDIIGFEKEIEQNYIEIEELKETQKKALESINDDIRDNDYPQEKNIEDLKLIGKKIKSKHYDIGDLHHAIRDRKTTIETLELLADTLDGYEELEDIPVMKELEARKIIQDHTELDTQLGYEPFERLMIQAMNINK